MTNKRMYVKLGILLGLCPLSAFAQVHTKQVLTGYKCMMLAKQWTGEGPVPSPVPVYDAPSPAARQIGVAGWYSYCADLSTTDRWSCPYGEDQWSEGLD